IRGSLGVATRRPNTRFCPDDLVTRGSDGGVSGEGAGFAAGPGSGFSGFWGDVQGGYRFFGGRGDHSGDRKSVEQGERVGRGGGRGADGGGSGGGGGFAGGRGSGR